MSGDVPMGAPAHRGEAALPPQGAGGAELSLDGRFPRRGNDGLPRALERARAPKANAVVTLERRPRRCLGEAAGADADMAVGTAWDSGEAGSIGTPAASRLGSELVSETTHGEHVAADRSGPSRSWSAAADVDIDESAVSEVVVAPGRAPAAARARAPCRELTASSQSSRNSVRVRCTSSPLLRTTPASGMISRSPNSSCTSPGSPTRARRSRARMRAASSLGSKGLVT